MHVVVNASHKIIQSVAFCQMSEAENARYQIQKNFKHLTCD